jgi:hypothetical protein
MLLTPFPEAGKPLRKRICPQEEIFFNLEAGGHNDCLKSSSTVIHPKQVPSKKERRAQLSKGTGMDV